MNLDYVSILLFLKRDRKVNLFAIEVERVSSLIRMANSFDENGDRFFPWRQEIYWATSNITMCWASILIFHQEKIE